MHKPFCFVFLVGLKKKGVGRHYTTTPIRIFEIN